MSVQNGARDFVKKRNRPKAATFPLLTLLYHWNCV